jgi:hypothetical protein
MAFYEKSVLALIPLTKIPVKPIDPQRPPLKAATTSGGEQALPSGDDPTEKACACNDN